MRGQADASLQPRQAQFAANTRRQPRIGRWQARPHPFVEATQHQQIGGLQSRLDQTIDGEPRVPALWRPHRDLVHQRAQHRGEAFRLDQCRTMRRLTLQIVEQGRRRTPVRTRPQPLAA